MTAPPQLAAPDRPALAFRRPSIATILRAFCLVIAVAATLGCGRDSPPATVEGTLRLNGTPLDNCLVTFLPEPGQGAKGLRSSVPIQSCGDV